MIGPRALFGSAFALLAVGAVMGLSSSDSTTRSSTPAGASAVGAPPTEAGETRSADGGSSASPAGQPAAVAAASSIVENDKLTTGTTSASPSGAGWSWDRAANGTVDPQVRPDAGPAPAETGAATEAKEAQEPQAPQAPKPPARARTQKPAVSVARSPGVAAQRQRDARPAATPVASAPQFVRAVNSARVIDEAAFLR